MAGTPIKRARKRAERAALSELPKAQAEVVNTSLTALVPLRPTQTVLAPEEGPDVTHTALKRAMRRRAAAYAEEAIAVLARNLHHQDPKIAAEAANKLLEWGMGKPAQEIEAGEGLQIAIVKFSPEG